MLSVRNWARNVEFYPREIINPSDETQISDVINESQKSGRKVRVKGSAHSFTPLLATPDVLLSLDRLQGLIGSDQRSATVWAGTKLKRLGEELFNVGLGLENLGDIDVQSIAGAVSTGTHGTGVRLGILPTQVEEMWFVNGCGELVHCSESVRPEVFASARLSLGALGVLTRLKLRALPRYRLEMRQLKTTLGETLERIEEYNRDYRHFEFFWFPHSQHALTKLTKETMEQVVPSGFAQKFSDVVLENVAFEVLSRVSRAIPKLAPKISQLCGSQASAGFRRDWSHRVFASPRWVKFVEMEYSIPIAEFRNVIREIEAELARNRHLVHFPIECRFVQSDGISLSPAYGGDRAFIAVHMYRGMAFQDYFNAMEKIFRAHGGRPHWGKMHSLKAADLQELYPQWSEFQNIRARMDPKGLFETDYMRGLWQR